MVTLFRNSFLIIISSFSLIFSQNHSLSFDGVDDYVEFDSQIIPQSGNYTIQAWVYASNIQTYLTFLSQGGNSESPFYIGIKDGYVRVGGWSDAVHPINVDSWSS